MKSILTNVAVTVVTVLVMFGAWQCYNRTHSAANSETYLRAARISEGFSLLGSTKRYVAAYYEDKGQWPASNAEAGLRPPAEFATQSVTSLTVSEGGVLTARFNEKSGRKNGLLRFIPSVDQETGIHWQCSTNLEVGSWAPQCRVER
jgi:Pilin (bacterial filament)